MGSDGRVRSNRQAAGGVHAACSADLTSEGTPQCVSAIVAALYYFVGVIRVWYVVNVCVTEFVFASSQQTDGSGVGHNHPNTTAVMCMDPMQSGRR